MQYTISTHVGDTLSLKHNLRIGSFGKQAHIRQDGQYEAWVDECKSINEAYDKLFGEALKEYNQKQIEQGRPNRVIDSYLEKVRNDKKKKEAYEMICTVGSSADKEPLDDETIYLILKMFLEEFIKLNKNIYVLCAVYHNDEAHPHLHISFVPFSERNKRGLSRQNSMSKALEEMGYQSNGYSDTSLIQWTKEQNQLLERICNEHGVEIHHPQSKKEQVQHLEKEVYILEQEKKELQAELQETKSMYNQIIELYNELVDKYNLLKQGCKDTALEVIEHFQKRNKGFERVR